MDFFRGPTYPASRFDDQIKRPTGVFRKVHTHTVREMHNANDDDETNEGLAENLRGRDCLWESCSSRLDLEHYCHILVQDLCNYQVICLDGTPIMRSSSSASPLHLPGWRFEP